MTEGVIKTKDTRLFFGYAPGASSSDSDGVVVHQVACPTGIPALSSGPKPKKDMTCLSSKTMQYFDGLADPPEMPIPINFIPRSESHQALIEAKRRGRDLIMPFMVVMADQPGAPTTIDTDGNLVSPGPTSVGWKAYVSNFEVTAQTGDIWRGTVTLQLQFDDDVEDLDWDLPNSDLLP